MLTKSDFHLNPDISYLNHGSFGACPKVIFDDYQQWQLQLERDPVQFITKTGPQALKKAREALGEFINCAPEDLVFVPNPTYAVNILAKNLVLSPGDEILCSDLEYGAMDRTWKHYCGIHGTKMVRQHINLPIRSHELVVEEFFKGLTARTKVVFISEITSTTALKLPVKEICRIAKQKGLITIVDGAHSPAHIPVDLEKLEADFYTGACHKWMLTPKGSSFLFAKKEFQKILDPLVVSWGYDADFPSDSQFLDYHQFNGTRDFSAYLTLPLAIDVLKKNNWEIRMKESQRVLLNNYQRFCKLVGTEPICPINEKFIGQIVSIPINCSEPSKLKELLFSKYKIEIPVMPHNDKVYLRISFQFYNELSEIEHLYESIQDILKTTDLLG